MRQSLALATAVLLALPPSLAAQTAPQRSSDSSAVAATLDNFLRVFERLDWEQFRRSFSDSAVVFFPSQRTPREFAGRAAVEARFRHEFDIIRAQSGASAPPYMHLEPHDLRITILSHEYALVTFTLLNSSRTGRRTILFRREGTEWRIWHLHASNAPWPD